MAPRPEKTPSQETQAVCQRPPKRDHTTVEMVRTTARIGHVCRRTGLVIHRQVQHPGQGQHERSHYTQVEIGQHPEKGRGHYPERGLYEIGQGVVRGREVIA